jgi:uncharacterized protein YceK
MSKNSSTASNAGSVIWGLLLCSFVIGGCGQILSLGSSDSGTSTTTEYKSNYGTSSEKLGGASNPFTQVDGYNEEDALIYAILKSEGYSHEDAAIATMKSAW